MRACALVVACLGLTSLSAGQSLPPEVLLLARIKSHMRAELAQLPNFTCLETIERFRKEPGHPSPFQGQLKPLDTVRLEIVYSDHQEWYGSPGDRNLSAENPVQFIGSGMIGNGAFAMDLHNIFEGAIFTYRGKESAGSRMAVRYDFRLPQLLRALTISIQGGSATVGEKGSFWADPESLDLVRLESRVDEIPAYLPLEEVSLNMNYARTRIGEYNLLLAQQADLRMVETSGAASFDHVEFTHCRAFSTQSSIHFEPDPQKPFTFLPPEADPSPKSANEPVPAFLSVTLQLITPITDKDAVGTLIQGRVSGDVVRKGKIVIPNGSLVRGRIRRLERYQGGGDFILGLEFTEVDAAGTTLRFYADLLKIDRSPVIRPSLSDRVLVPNGRGGYDSKDATITLPELPGVASFFVTGTPFSLPAGFRMVWRTRGLIR